MAIQSKQEQNQRRQEDAKRKAFQLEQDMMQKLEQ